MVIPVTVACTAHFRIMRFQGHAILLQLILEENVKTVEQ
jgi:hypothetical protein